MWLPGSGYYLNLDTGIFEDRSAWSEGRRTPTSAGGRSPQSEKAGILSNHKRCRTHPGVEEAMFMSLLLIGIYIYILYNLECIHYDFNQKCSVYNI